MGCDVIAPVVWRFFVCKRSGIMRVLSKLIAVAVGTTAAAALVMAPAMADPINVTNGKVITPRPCDVVGVGSNTTESVTDQFSVNYNTALLKKLKKLHKGDNQSTSCKTQPKPFLYSWDALQNAAATSSPLIKFKSGCVKEERPNGSSAGIAALAADEGGTTGGHPCLDFARSSRAPKSTDPTNLTFVAFAQDNVTYASIGKSKKFRHGSNAPTNLTTADLHAMYSCTVTKWNQLPGNSKGSKATIHPLLPQAGSGTLAFFEAAIGITTPGPCVDEPTTLEENEGTDPIYASKNAPNEIVPFSAGKWLAQAYHSAKCKTSSCSTSKDGVNVLCQKPKKGQNRFGCDVNGNLKLNDINGTSPITSKRVLNSPKSKKEPKGYTVTFVRTLFYVVRGTDSIPGYLNAFFGPKGYVCSKGQAATITDYGYEPAHISGFPTCGSKIPG
jgi:ABC-type phosphate transport system substrate-binding protein